MKQLRQSHKISRQEVDTLCLAVETALGRRFRTPSDFINLSDIIFERASIMVSSTTLKRMWGYILDKGPDYLPSRYTMSALARLLGYSDYDALLTAQAQGEIQSASYIGVTIDSADVPEGAEIMVTWQPGRKLLLRSMGGCRFKVVEAARCRLAIGDEVEIHSFTQNAPLYFNSVVRPDHQPFRYIAGSRTGVNYTLLTT